MLPGLFFCVDLGQHSSWLNSMNICQVVLTEHSFLNLKDRDNTTDPSLNCHMLQKIKCIEIKEKQFPQKSRPCLAVAPPYFQLEEAGAMKAEKHSEREHQKRVISEAGYERGFFLLVFLCALKLIYSLIISQTHLIFIS